MFEWDRFFQVDFGVAAKVRPAFVISVPYADSDRAPIGVIPHTTAARGSQFEVVVDARFIGLDAFLVQGVQAFPPKYFTPAWRSHAGTTSGGLARLALLARYHQFQ